jgi:hypothetical protein
VTRPPPGTGAVAPDGETLRVAADACLVGALEVQRQRVVHGPSISLDIKILYQRSLDVKRLDMEVMVRT